MTKKNNHFEELADQLRALDASASSDGEGMLVARYVCHLSPNDWKEFCKKFPNNNWGAVSLSNPLLGQLADITPDTWGTKMLLALTTEAFVTQIQRELARLARMGGELSLVGAMPVSKRASDAQQEKLMTLLGEVLLANLEICDSLGLTTQGYPAILMLGAGQFRARNLAESIQRQFAKKASKICKDATCAVGIVGMCQGENLGAQDLLTRLATSLQEAMTDEQHIRQMGPDSLDARSTLVQSSEKRFLFFGGE